MFDPDTMRKRFHDLEQQRTEIEAKAKPLREKYEALLAQADLIKQQIRPVLDELKAIEAPLFAANQERAMITRMLAGRTGEAG